MNKESPAELTETSGVLTLNVIPSLRGISRADVAKVTLTIGVATAREIPRRLGMT